ncbi:MAG: hypothetical protein JWL72_4671, partial [Ilumatobacteraceae bacterium]|nr:hypothetical protein [Ilumatobacteraceae bacterium]
MIDDHVSPDNVAGGVPSRIIVMIAVENTESSVAVVRGAHRLLGDRADYFVLNVGESRSSSLSWAAVYPSGRPGVWLPTQNEMIEGDLPDAIQRAEDRASELAQDGSLAAA